MPRAEGFQHALSALAVSGENESLKRGVAAARRCLEAVARAAHATLSSRGLMLAGPFNYFIVQEVPTLSAKIRLRRTSLAIPTAEPLGRPFHTLLGLAYLKFSVL